MYRPKNEMCISSVRTYRNDFGVSDISLLALLLAFIFGG